MPLSYHLIRMSLGDRLFNTIVARMFKIIFDYEFKDNALTILPQFCTRKEMQNRLRPASARSLVLSTGVLGESNESRPL